MIDEREIGIIGLMVTMFLIGGFALANIIYTSNFNANIGVLPNETPDENTSALTITPNNYSFGSIHAGEESNRITVSVKNNLDVNGVLYWYALEEYPNVVHRVYYNNQEEQNYDISAHETVILDICFYAEPDALEMQPINYTLQFQLNPS